MFYYGEKVFLKFFYLLGFHASAQLTDFQALFP